MFIYFFIFHHGNLSVLPPQKLRRGAKKSPRLRRSRARARASRFTSRLHRALSSKGNVKSRMTLTKEPSVGNRSNASGPFSLASLNCEIKPRRILGVIPESALSPSAPWVTTETLPLSYPYAERRTRLSTITSLALFTGRICVDREWRWNKSSRDDPTPRFSR